MSGKELVPTLAITQSITNLSKQNFVNFSISLVNRSKEKNLMRSSLIIFSVEKNCLTVQDVLNALKVSTL